MKFAAAPDGDFRQVYWPPKRANLPGGAQSHVCNFEEHPGSVVLIIDRSVEDIFALDETAWRARVLREIRVGSHLYVVVRSAGQP